MTRSTPAIAAVLATALLATALAAQGPEAAARGRLAGLVRGPDDRPIAGATVTVFPQGQPGTGPPAFTTGPDGRWAFAGLEPGRWEIVVEAVGFFDGEGWLQVAAGPGGGPVEVELRSLDEATPRFSEGSPSTLQRWLEAGNELLEQERWAAAREEYEKALAVLPIPERPAVLQAVARTHFMEGDLDAALTALRRALAIAPRDAQLRQLIAGVFAAAGRPEEAAATIAEIEAGGPLPEDEAGAATPPPAPPIAPLPLVEPEAGRTGRFRTRFSQASPLSGIETYLQRFGFERQEIVAVDPSAGAYDPAEESYEVYVPEAGEGPYALFVWVSPIPFGGFGREETRRLLEDRRIIWIGANRSGNGRPAWYRIALALDAVHAMRQLYEIDPRRIWVGGYSGGGRITSQLAMLYPEVFRGGFSFFGCDYFRSIAVPDRPGARWPPKFPEPGRRSLAEVREASGFVLLTGSRDFNRAQTKATWRQMQRDGFEHVTYLEIPGADHYSGGGREWMERGFEALEAAAATSP